MEESEDSFEEDYEEESIAAKPVKKKTQVTRLDGKVQLIFGFLFMGLLAAMMYIRMNYVLSKQEDILSIIVIVLSMITGLMAILMGVKDICRGGFSKAKNKEKENPLEEGEDDYGYDYNNAYEDDFMTDIDYSSEDNFRQKICVTPSIGKRPVTTCGETVVLMSEEDSDKDITLYSRNADKTIRIPLGKFPLTIGKMEGCVDKVINDMSISRIHCRFNKDSQGRIFVVDLGSTNGTFRNGLRLNPQEDCFIDEGDEIKIGRICFDCR